MAGDAKEREALLQDAVDRAVSDPVAITVRDLIKYWGAYGRGYLIVDRISADLRMKGLETSPDFAAAHLDSHVQLVAVSEAEEIADLHSEVELRVSSLTAATNGVLSVRPGDEIERAYTEMALNDYSQLAVMASEKTLNGYISWESIGKAGLAHSPMKVRDCTMPAGTVGLDDALLPLLPEIADKNFVFVQARDSTLSGIITASDITLEFGALAGPYFLVGEIERRLRRIVDQHFDVSDSGNQTSPVKRERVAKSAEDLTLGQLARLFESPDRWGKLEWHIDRTAFVQRLHTVRDFRNRLMHFDEEPPQPGELQMLSSFAAMLKSLWRSP